MDQELPPPLSPAGSRFGPLMLSACSPLFLWLLAVFLLGVGLRFWMVMSRPETPDKGMLGIERLVLVAEFAPGLDQETRNGLWEVALAGEGNPALGRLRLKEPLRAGESEKLTSGLDLLASYQAEPDPAKETELRRLASRAQTRLLSSVAMLGGLLLTALALAFLAPSGRPGGDVPRPMLAAAGPVAVLIGFLAWDVLHTFVLSTAIELTHLRARLPLVAYLYLVQGAAYGLFLLLARLMGAREWNFRFPFAAAWAGRGYFLCYALVLAVNLLIAAVTGTVPTSSNPLLDMFLGGGEVWLLALLVVVIGPLFEELIFRGWLLGGLRESWGDGKALLVSSLLFAVIHGDPWATPALFVLGCVFGAVYLRSGSVYGSLILHSMWNATTFTLLYANIP